MDKENIMGKMSDYDFTAPVTVTTIFEESDEDVNTVIKIEHESDEELIAESESNGNIKDESLVDDLKSPVNLNDKVLINNEANKQPKEKAIEDILAEIEKSCKKYCENKSVKILNENNRLKRKLESTDSTLTKMRKDINSYQGGTSIISNQRYSINPSMQTTATQPNTFNIQVAGAYVIFVKNILNTLSEYLRIILDAYYCYATARDSNKSSQLETSEKQKDFMQAKHHFFNLSFVVIENIILPQKNNENFIKKFVHLTAQSNIMKYNVDNVYSLLKEMMDWTKQKQDYIKNISDRYRNSNSPTTNNSLLKQQLNEPPKAIKPPKRKILSRSSKDSNTKSLANKNDTTASNTCILSTGPPGREINIGVHSNALNYHNGQITDPKQYNPTEQDNRIIQNPNFDPNQPSCPYANFQQVDKQRTAQQQLGHLNVSVFANHINQNSVGQFSNRTIPPPSYTNAVNWRNFAETTNQNCISKHSTMPSNAIQQATSKLPFLNEFHDHQDIQENARSLSTDSGFMSPPPYNIPMEVTTQRNAGQENLPSNLYLNHITSLNQQNSSNRDMSLSSLIDWTGLSFN